MKFKILQQDKAKKMAEITQIKIPLYWIQIFQNSQPYICLLFVTAMVVMDIDALISWNKNYRNTLTQPKATQSRITSSKHSKIARKLSPNN